MATITQVTFDCAHAPAQAGFWAAALGYRPADPPAGSDTREEWQLSDTGQPVVPQPGREIPILIGGTIDRTVDRTIRWGVGYTAGGGGPEMMAPIAAKVRTAWAESGRAGEPRVVALTYFALGPDAGEGAASYLKDYYGFLGPWADRIAESAPTSPEALKGVAAAFEDLGVDELICDPTIARLDQVDRLADELL
jgi:alkanesulfonate monooxygenase SsuD/methylene tetrahydromethanopterin reductase-like flavin-dependent oxidoreductase (luciferase family)